MLTRNLRKGILFSLALAFVVMTGIALYGDIPHMVAAVAHFRWQYLPLILGLTLFNYAGRFTKWQYYLHRLHVRIPWGKSLLIFLSGLSMAITPGKVGELLKSYLLKRSTGEPMSRTAPVIVCERLTDGVAMIGLAATGLVLYRFGWELLLALFILGFAIILLAQNRALAFAERLPGVSRIAHMARIFYESAYTLLQWKPVLLGILIGFISWSGECGALYFVYAGLGVGPGLDLFIKAMFILAVSSLVGSASGLPGGLGTADGSMVGLTRLLISPSATLGGSATLLIRLCTLWFGLGLGVAALLVFRSIQHIHLFAEREDECWPGRTDENARALPLTDAVPAAVTTMNGERVS